MIAPASGARVKAAGRPPEESQAALVAAYDRWAFEQSGTIGSSVEAHLEAIRLRDEHANAIAREVARQGEAQRRAEVEHRAAMNDAVLAENERRAAEAAKKPPLWRR